MLRALTAFLFFIAALAASAQDTAFREHYAGAAMGGYVAIELTAQADGAVSVAVRRRGMEDQTLAGTISAEGNLVADGSNGQLEASRDMNARELVGTLQLNGQSAEIKLPMRAEWEILTWNVGDKIEADLAWPRVFFDGSPKADLNEALRYYAIETAEGFLTEMRDLADEADMDRPGPWFSLGVSVDVYYIGSTFFSGLATQYEYTGGAHPNSYSTALNYEIQGETAVELKLGDLFADPEAGIRLVSAKCVASLRQQGASSIKDDPNATLTEEELMAWTIGPESLVIYFDPYAVGSYAEGSYTVTIPLAELSGLKPGGVAARLRG